MKRFSFIAALCGLGVAKAQQWKVCKPASVTKPLNIVVCSSDNMPALNNQCPVCGEMAKAFHKPFEWEYYPSGFIQDGKPVNLARCKRCNAAFFQEPE